MIKLNVSPLSVNMAYRGRRFKTNGYKFYKEWLSYNLPKIEIPEGDIKLKMEIGVWSRFDVDNALKPFIDCLQKQYGFNDNRITQINIKKNVVKKGKEYIKFKLL